MYLGINMLFIMCGVQIDRLFRGNGYNVITLKYGKHLSFNLKGGTTV